MNIRVYSWLVWGLIGLCCLAGCAQHDYKADADEKVYNIIDQKWREEFGSKANYKVSDVAPSPDDIQIAKTIPAGSVLSLPQAVAIATAHNRDYQLEKELLYTMALDLRLTRHGFETRYFSGARQAYGKEGPDEGVGGEVDLGFDRLLAGGTRIGTKVGIAWFSVLTGDVSGGLASILSAAITQPLLRGSSREVVQENLTQAERNTLYQLRSFNRFRKTFVVLVITQYYQTLQLLEVAEHAKQNCETLTWLGSRVEKLVAAGRLPAEELDRVRQEILQARDAYLQAHKEYGLMLDSFKITLGMPTTAEFHLDARELNSLRAMQVSYPDFSEVQAIETALAQRLDLANSADAIADAERKVLVAADALRGELNIFVGVDATSLTDSSELAGVGALDDASVTDRNRLNPLRRLRDNNPLRSFLNESEIGIDGELPLDRVAEQNVFRKALLTLNQRKRECELAQDTMRLEIRQAYRDLTEAIERYKVSSEGLKLAQKRFRNTVLLMKYGRASSRRVLNAQNALFDAQDAASEALVNYIVATLNFYRDSGVLQVRPDGMWERRTAKG